MAPTRFFPDRNTSNMTRVASFWLGYTKKIMDPTVVIVCEKLLKKLTRKPERLMGRIMSFSTWSGWAPTSLPDCTMSDPMATIDDCATLVENGSCRNTTFSITMAAVPTSCSGGERKAKI